MPRVWIVCIWPSIRPPHTGDWLLSPSIGVLASPRLQCPFPTRLQDLYWRLESRRVQPQVARTVLCSISRTLRGKCLALEAKTVPRRIGAFWPKVVVLVVAQCPSVMFRSIAMVLSVSVSVDHGAMTRLYS